MEELNLDHLGDQFFASFKACVCFFLKIHYAFDLIT